MKVLLVDTGFSALPIYDHLVASGHDVWAMGNRPNDSIARRAGPRWIAQDYSNVLEVGRHADRLGIERLVPGCTDVSIKTCTEIRGGDGYLDRAEVNDILADKKAFRSLCDALNLPAPRSVPAGQLPDKGHFICKPSDAFSGRGITVFNAGDVEATRQAIAAAKEASPTGQVVVETFVEGHLHSWSVFIESGCVRDGFFVLEGSSINPYAVDTSFVRYDMPRGCAESLCWAIEKIAAELNLTDGLVHTQFLWDGEAAFIVEITRRCPGDLYAMLIEYSTGYAYAGKYTSYFLGRASDTSEAFRRDVVRHTVTSAEGKIFSGLDFHDDVSIRAFYSLQSLGSVLEPGHGGRIGILFCQAGDGDARDLLYRKFIDRNVYRVL